MKFKLLSIGQKFEYEGDVYVKTSPLVASNIETSHNKMIPRYATLKLLDQEGIKEQQVKQASINTQEVLDAFNTFYESCIETLESKDMLMPLIKDELDKAKDEFIKRLV